MMTVRSLFLLLMMLVVTPSAMAQSRYTARQNGETVVLEDTRSQIVVSALPVVGNIVYSMKVKGQDVLKWPFASVDEFKARPAMSGIPFVGPWANRLDEQAFYANGKKYPFDMTLGNVRGAIPIHGFLTTTDQWRVVEVKADAAGAWVTSRLDFFAQPAWMKQFPFAHTVEVTYRLADGELQVRTRILNMSAEQMPVAIGFHPYFRLTDSPREAWTISAGVRTHWLLSPAKIPTGETEAVEKFFPNPQAASLKDYNLDDVFSDLIFDAQGKAHFSVKGKQQQLEVLMDSAWKSAVIWSPTPPATPPRGGNAAQNDPNFIAFEPMAGITDAMNLAQKGLYRELQSIPPGGSWESNFWVGIRKTSGGAPWLSLP